MQAGTLRVRVLAYQRGRLVATSQPHKLIVHAVKGLPVVPVSPNAMVLDSSTITSAPAPGAAGTLVYSGGNDAKVGDIIAIGVGPSTPDGFLGQVTAVTTHGADTTVSTVPASLLQAIPSASFDTTSTSVTASTARVTSHALRAAEDKAVQCHGSATATIGSSASVGASIELKGSWSVFHGLQTASLTANAGVSASVTATVAGQGSCTLNPVTVADLPGPKDAFFVGPFPVVITSKITVDVDAKATAAAKLTASIGGGFSARAGLGWTKTGGFYPINTFTPHFTAPAPTITANATVDANLTPTLHVLIDGAEAQLALKAGLAFDADITQNPWWTLNAPVSLTGNLNIPVLKLSSPTLHIYDHTFPLANSGGPFPGSTTTGGPGPTGPTAPPASSGPAIGNVTFSGGASNPQVTINGSGFGGEPTASNASGGGYTGDDYGNSLYVCDTTSGPNRFCAGQNDGLGKGFDTVGLNVTSYSDTQVTYALGSAYSQLYFPMSIYELNQGDQFTAYVNGLTCSGSVGYGGSPIPCAPSS
jgi:hypothetical protein